MIEDREKLNHQVVCEYLVDKYIDRISGNEKEILIGKTPQETVLVGMLKPYNKININHKNESVYESIPSISVIFNLKPNEDAKIKIQVTGSFYYSIKPTFEDEINYLLKKYSIKYKKDFKEISDLKNYLKEQNEIIKDEVIVKYKRIKLSDIIEPIEINLHEINNSKINDIINKKINEYIINNVDDSFAIKKLKMKT